MLGKGSSMFPWWLVHWLIKFRCLSLRRSRFTTPPSPFQRKNSDDTQYPHLTPSGGCVDRCINSIDLTCTHDIYGWREWCEGVYLETSYVVQWYTRPAYWLYDHEEANVTLHLSQVVYALPCIISIACPLGFLSYNGTSTSSSCL